MRANLVYYNGSIGADKRLPIAGQTTLGATSVAAIRPDDPLAPAA